MGRWITLECRKIKEWHLTSCKESIPPRPSLDESGPEVWIISKRFGLVGQGYLKSGLLTQSGFSLHCCLLHLHRKWAMHCNTCFFYFVNTANLLYLHRNQAQKGLVKMALYAYIEKLDFYASMKDICIWGAIDKCIKLCFALVNHCTLIQSDLHCF